MIGELSSLLLNHDGQRRLDAHVADMIRKPDLAGAEQFLLDGFRAYPSPISEICLSLSLADVRITGWEKLDSEFEFLAGKGKECTVVGMNLSNYSDPPAEPWHWKEPVIENWYGDDDYSRFPFSSATRDDILRENGSYGTPWQGGGLGGDGAAMDVTGLKALNSALLAYDEQRDVRTSPRSASDPGRTTPDFVTAKLGGWFMHLRFHQAVWRDLRSRGLARRVPVIVGTHGVGPFLESVYFVEKVSDHKASTNRILAEEAAAFRARVMGQIAALEKSLRERRQDVRGGPMSSPQAQTRLEYYKCDERLQNSMIGVSANGFSWELSDREFEAYLAALRRDVLRRNNMLPPEPDTPTGSTQPCSAPPGSPPPGNGLRRALFGRKGV